MAAFDEFSASYWTQRCDLASKYFKYLEDQLVSSNNTNDTIVTYARINPLLACKEDCQFDRMLSVTSNFTQDRAAFAANVLNYLNRTISCRTSTIGSLITPPATASDLISNLSKILIFFFILI